jgi:hypothetical protein
MCDGVPWVFFAAWWSLLSKKACCGSKYQAQSCLFSFLAEILPNFFWQPKCQTLFLAAKTIFGSWHAGTRGIHTGFNIFGSEKRLWQNPAKNKSRQPKCQK